MPYYKTVTRYARSSNERYSVVANKEFEVTYPIGKWAEAPGFMQDWGYHLFVFTNLTDAKNFAHNELYTENWEIWEVDVDDTPLPIKPRLHLELLEHQPISHSALYRADTELDWPSGTRMVKRVKLLKMVEKKVDVWVTELFPL